MLGMIAQIPGFRFEAHWRPCTLIGYAPPRPRRRIVLGISVRAIESNDLARIRAVFEQTTSQDRYCRFFTFKDDLGDAELRRFVEFDERTIGLIAEDGGKPVGMAHAWIDDHGAGELGIIVSTDVRRRGVGRNLVRAIERELLERKVQDLYAYALGENASFAALARSLGLARTSVESGVVTYRRRLTGGRDSS